MPNIYQGPSSCYARKEGVWVPGSGVTAETLPSFIALIVRDLRRGRSYDEECREIPLDVDRAIARLQYLIALARKHGGEVDKVYTEEALERLYREFKLPPGVSRVRLAGYRDSLDRVAREVEELLGVSVAREYAGEVGEGKRRAVAMAR